MKLWDKDRTLIDNVKELMALGAIIGTVFTILGGILYFIFDDEIHKIQESLDAPKKIEYLEEKINKNSKRIIEDSTKFEKYILTKSSTFAIGLRVDENGQIWYRHTDGKLHRAYPDPEYAWEDFEVFVWYDKNGTKRFCY